MLGQIRRLIAKKNEKLFYIFVLFIVAFGISIVHYMSLEKDAVLSLKQDDVSSTYYAKYHYLSKNVNNIRLNNSFIFILYDFIHDSTLKVD